MRLPWQAELSWSRARPKAVDAHLHPGAYALLQRGVARLCRYFARCRIEPDVAELAAALWARFGEPVRGASVACLAEEAKGATHA